MVIWSGFAGEKSASTSRLELVRVLSFLWVTTVSNRRDSRLEFGAFEGRGILGRRLADCEPNREMLPLPAFVPGGFMCSSKRFGAVPGRFRSGQVGGSEGRPRAGIASNCVVILRLLCGCVNGTEGLRRDTRTVTSYGGPKAPCSQTKHRAPEIRAFKKKGGPPASFLDHGLEYPALETFTEVPQYFGFVVEAISVSQQQCPYSFYLYSALNVADDWKHPLLNLSQKRRDTDLLFDPYRRSDMTIATEFDLASVMQDGNESGTLIYCGKNMPR